VGNGVDTRRLHELLAALKGSALLAPYAVTSTSPRNEQPLVLHSDVLPFSGNAANLHEREQTDPRLYAVVEAQEQLDGAATVSETIALCCETIIRHFDVARLAVALQDDSGSRYEVTGVWEMPEELGTIPADAAAVFLSKNKVKKTVPFDARMQASLPSVQASRCSTIPLQSRDKMFGFLLMFDSDLAKGDLMLLAMVAQATAASLASIIEDEEQARARALSDRVMTVTNSLLLVDKKEELYHSILETASDLVEATQGCIILMDDTGAGMEIAFTRGISPDAVHSARIEPGAGLAGVVAQTGEALLVNGPEQEPQMGTSRPLFASKSQLGVPLKLKGKVIGVLVLAEKKTGHPFTKADLQTVSSFANLAPVMIERTSVLEKSIEFEQLSVTDALTGLYNRRFLKSRLEAELNRSHHQELDLSVLFIDLDHFKSYNDLCGHLAGDLALKKVAEIVRGCVREMDIVARYGGEEFCAVLPGTSKAEALLVAERIRSQIGGERFSGNDDLGFRSITASIGVASFPEDGRTFTTLIHASDVAVYQAKGSGRNKIVAAGTPAGEVLPSADLSVGRTVDISTYLAASGRTKA
jgi:diguanylate cyclase (GGDEF)-like protein